MVTVIHNKAKNQKPTWKWNGKAITNYEITRAMLLEGGTLECVSSLGFVEPTKSATKNSYQKN